MNANDCREPHRKVALWCECLDACPRDMRRRSIGVVCSGPREAMSSYTERRVFVFRGYRFRPLPVTRLAVQNKRGFWHFLPTNVQAQP